MNFFKRRAILKKANLLELIPIKLVAYETERNQVTLLLPKFTSKLGIRYFMPKLSTPFIRVKLDTLGSATWLAIDCKRNVATLIEVLQKDFGEQTAELEDRIAKFIMMLYEQKFLSFSILQDE